MLSIPLCKSYLVKEAVGASSLGESYLVADAASKRGIATIDETVSAGLKVAKAFFDKAFLPLHLKMCNADGKALLSISRPASLLGSVFTVYDSDSKVLCRFKQKLTLLTPLIVVEDAQGAVIGQIKGDYRFNNFKLTSTNGQLISSISHYVESLIKAVFTTADDYRVEMQLEGDLHQTLITLAAVICIDFLYHEV